MLRNWLKKFRLKSVQAGDGQRSVDNIDAMTAAAQNRGVDPTGSGGCGTSGSVRWGSEERHDRGGTHPGGVGGGA